MRFKRIKLFIDEDFKYIFVIIIVFLLALYVLGIQMVIGNSMNPNFQNGDVLIYDKLTCKAYNPKRGDVVTINYKNDEYLIKRIVGLPGEKIEYIDNVLYINGVKQTENYLSNHTTDNFNLSILNVDVIPEGKYVVLGDNRENSLDSRNPQVGLVDKKDIIGKIRVKLWPIFDFEIYK